MAALAVGANVALRALEALGPASVAPALAALQRGLDADRRAAAAALCRDLDAPVRAVTTSASAGVVEALHEMRRQDLLLGVVVGESRPLLEGTALARWLAEQGHDVTLVVDAGLGEHLGPDAVFLVGTDAILPDAIVNKRGTRLIATWARLSGARRYVLATRDKLYPPDLAPLCIDPARPAAELLHDPPAALHVDNRAFDRSALGLWTAILVGAQTLPEALSSGDRSLAQGLRPLLGGAGPG
jgi:translation initiation factor 2B subunit (eIF-2B alpha/beta/delta family)